MSLDSDDGYNEDILKLDDAQRKIEDLAHSLACLDAPSWFINPLLKSTFQERTSYDSIAALSPLTLAPTLYNVLFSAESPSKDFFRSLPKPSGKCWAIYSVLLEKSGCTAKLYIGSGTNAESGVTARIKNYKPGDPLLPRFVNQAFNNGFTVSRFGSLCWTEIPSAALVPRVRARFLLLEAVFTIIFHASFAAITDHHFWDLLPWPRSTAQLDPLCSHLSLSEKVIGDLGLSAEELERMATLRHEKHKVQWQGSRARIRAADPEGYRERARIEKNAWSKKHSERLAKVSAKNRETAKEAARFFCHDCDMALATQFAINKHLVTKAHKDRARGIKKSSPTKSARAVALVRAQAKANKTYYCPTCDKAFNNDYSLTRHKTTALHAKRLLRKRKS